MKAYTGYSLFNKEMRQDIRETQWVKYGKNPTHQEITDEVNNIWNNLDQCVKDIWNTNATIKSNQKKNNIL
jgi:hypothetical protein